jgi:hypothetical protein
MGCLFSKSVAEGALLQEDVGASLPTASDASNNAGLVSGVGEPEQIAGGSGGRVAFNSKPTAMASSSAPSTLKPMGKGGFADIKTGLQEQLGRYAAKASSKLLPSSHAPLAATSFRTQLEGAAESLGNGRGGYAIHYERERP